MKKKKFRTGFKEKQQIITHLNFSSEHILSKTGGFSPTSASWYMHVHTLPLQLFYFCQNSSFLPFLGKRKNLIAHVQNSSVVLSCFFCFTRCPTVHCLETTSPFKRAFLQYFRNNKCNTPIT